MPNPAYQKGVRFEREVVTAFRKIGCQATRSAGSHGVWDVTVHTDCDAVRKQAYQLLPMKDAKSCYTGHFDWETTWQGDPAKVIYFTVVESPEDSVWLIQCKVNT